MKRLTSKAELSAIAERNSGNVCYFCGESNTYLPFFVAEPIDSEKNYQLVCKSCSSRRRARDYFVYLTQRFAELELERARIALLLGKKLGVLDSAETSMVVSQKANEIPEKSEQVSRKSEQVSRKSEQVSEKPKQLSQMASEVSEEGAEDWEEKADAAWRAKKASQSSQNPKPISENPKPISENPKPISEKSKPDLDDLIAEWDEEG